MQDLRLVPVLRADNGFHARVVAARLGAEGIVTQFRGNVDGPYPMGTVEVLVTADDLVAARELLLADEVDAVLADVDDDEGRRPAPRIPPWFLVGAVVVLAGLALAQLAALGR